MPKLLKNTVLSLFFALAYTQAHASIGDEFEKFKKTIAGEVKLQNSIRRNYSIETYGACNALALKLMAEQANGLKLSSGVSSNLGFMLASTQYFRGNSNIPSAALDKVFNLYWNELKLDTNQYLTNNLERCYAIIQKIASQAGD